MRWILRVLLTLFVAVSVAACSSDSKTAAASPVTVFAAASLTESFNELSPPGLDTTYNFAGSGALVTQVQQGAPADVIATADTASMKKLTDAGLVETPITFAKNALQILVAPGNPLGIKTLNDLARPDIKFVTEDETVPAGKYSAQVLEKAGVTTNPVSKEPDVKSAVAKVTSGEADATIVYVTDVNAAGSKGQGVVIPEAHNVVAEYPIAIVKGTPHHDAAASFVDAVVNGEGQDALSKHGFLRP
jgi:molybdate transport system substrate-binding protein